MPAEAQKLSCPPVAPGQKPDLAFADIGALRAAYAAGLDPAEHLKDIYRRIAETGPRPVWISLLPLDEALSLLAEAARRLRQGEDLPLFGIPFAVKDNIDVAGLPTTAGCPDYTYMPQRHATVVARLIAAGAIPVGKTNLDQFATGLNGTRSPYGIPTCVFDGRYVSGGSSSGSAVAVASGLVPFSLGTDTAGSGRVPAAFNNLVGVKPTKGLLSSRGMVPAARSLDCVSVFAGTVADAVLVTGTAAGYDAQDAFSRPAPVDGLAHRNWGPGFRFGVPSPGQLNFFGDGEAARLFADAVSRLEALGGVCVSIDYQPFLEAAALLYAGPWVAERLAALKEFAEKHAEALNPVVRDIVLSAKGMSAVDAFEGQYRLAELIRQAEAEWRRMDVLLLPTAPTIYSVEAMLADPVRLNSNLGHYTNFVNLMDLSAIAVPAGFRPGGLPFGVTLIGRAFEDMAIATLGDRLHRALPGATLAASGQPLPPAAAPAGAIGIAVVGAHLSGQPLNGQLLERGGTLRAAARTAPGYALYALAETVPPKPGLVRDARAAGRIEIEIWDLPPAGFASFVNEIPAPLGIGTLTLEDGTTVKGFLCESYAIEGARDITAFGGWRAYRASLA